MTSTLGVPRIEEQGEQCLLSLGQDLNVDLFGTGGFEDGSLCFESEDGFLPSARYDSLADMPSVSPCDSGEDFFWSDSIEGFEGLDNVGTWVRDVESGRLWKVLILTNLGDRFEAIGEEVPQ